MNDNPRKVAVIFTEQNLKFLSNILWETSDCGPDLMGLASDELIELRGIIDSYIERG